MSLGLIGAGVAGVAGYRNGGDGIMGWFGLYVLLLFIACFVIEADTVFSGMFWIWGFLSVPVPLIAAAIAFLLRGQVILVILCVVGSWYSAKFLYLDTFAAIASNMAKLAQ